MAGDSQKAIAQEEVCTVKALVGRRRARNGQSEYLVQWQEFPGEDTWEPTSNLKNVKHLIQQFEDDEISKSGKQMAEMQLIKKRDRKANEKKQKKIKLQPNYEQYSFEKKDELEIIRGLKRSKLDGQLMCKIYWKPRVEGEDIPKPTFVPFQIVKQHEPIKILEYLEAVGKVYEKS